MIFGASLMSAGFIAASFASEVWQLYLSQGALVGLGIGFIWIPSMAILPQWFDKKRSLASAIGSAGSGIGGLIFSFGTQAMIDSISLAWSLRIIGIVCGVTNTASALLFRNRNKSIRPPQRGFDTKLLRRYDVLLLISWAFISMLGYITILFSPSDFALSIGLSSSQAAAVSGFLNIGTAVGRPFIGIISDRYGRMETAGIITLICGMTCFAIWLPANSYGVAVFFALINGGMLGVFWMVSTASTHRYVATFPHVLMKNCRQLAQSRSRWLGLWSCPLFSRWPGRLSFCPQRVSERNSRCLSDPKH